MTLRGAWSGLVGVAVLLAGATADALLAALVVLLAGLTVSLVWYVVVEGAPPLGSVLAAWNADRPISLGLFLPPCLTLLAAIIAGTTRFAGALWESAMGGRPLRWLPRVQRLLGGAA